MYLTVAAYTDPILAHIVRGRLEAEGLDAWVADEHTVLADWYMRQALGGAKVRVAVAQFAQAREIVRAIDSGDFVLEESEGRMPPPCRESLSSRIAYAMLFTFYLPVPWLRRSAVDR
jgi:hypothetical protein